MTSRHEIELFGLPVVVQGTVVVEIDAVAENQSKGMLISWLVWTSRLPCTKLNTLAKVIASPISCGTCLAAGFARDR